MNDVKDLCDRILDGPAPPLRDSMQVLAVARHAAQRRARLTSAVVRVAGAAVAALAVALSGTHAGVPSALQPTTAASAYPAPAPMPDAESAQAHGSRIAQVLAQALPAGYSGRPDGGTSTWRLATDTTGRQRFVSQTRLVVSDNDGEGILSATLVADGSPAPTDDLCASPTTARLDAYIGVGRGTCSVIAAGAVGVRVDVGVDRSVTATRFLSGGYLAIRWSDGGQPALPPADAAHPWISRGDSGHPPLRVAAFTAPELARLAADPRLLP